MADYIVVHGIRIAKDFAPETFGRLTTIGPVFWLTRKRERQSYQVCQCNCGTVATQNAKSIRTGNTLSCGCIKKELMAKRNHRHGETYSQEYRTFAAMRQRCYCPGQKHYANYGGRGIHVCDRWLEPGGQGFINFLADMGRKPHQSYTIERNDHNKGYSPDNCCWIPKSLQSRNQRRSRLITINGRTQCVVAWAEEYRIKPSTVFDRLYTGWKPEEALTTPPGTKRKKPSQQT